ncbi:MAG: hypothetical protein KJ561_08375, partial [Nanoarchaeota archaeon]|nr:hypothetical protein [Nanoarchaeota archaeon]
MRNNHYLYSIAVFMIALIISLPIYASAASAALTFPSLRGNDGIRGYIREQDTIYYNVTAEISGDAEITSSQVHLQGLSGPEFDYCYPKGNNKFVCEYMMSSSSVSGNTFQSTISLYNDGGSLDKAVSLDGAKDLEGPVITSFTVTPSVVGSGNVNINYRIEDIIYNGSSGRCTGIKNFIVSSGAYSKLVNINTAPGNCVYEGSFTENADSITAMASGTVVLEATAYDNFNQESQPVTTTLTIDKIPPVIDTNSFKLLNSNNREIEYVSGPEQAHASIDVQ